jgi:hypothetical protein
MSVCEVLRPTSVPSWNCGRQQLKYSRLMEYSGIVAAVCVCVCVFIVSGVRLSLFGTAAATGLLYQPQMIVMVIVEKLVE